MFDPATLKFAPSHEWVHVDGDLATIGISAFAVQALTDLVHVELPKVGRTLQPGQSFGVVESVKSANDLYSPVKGDVVEVNSQLPNNLDWASQSPYGSGWLIKVKLADHAALGQLMDFPAYEQHCAADHH